jgi:hypothetical protein
MKLLLQHQITHRETIPSLIIRNNTATKQPIQGPQKKLFT